MHAAAPVRRERAVGDRASITTRPCGTTRPLPMLMWPTSLLPITPAGRPTASPLASSVGVRIAFEHARASSADRRGDRVAVRSRAPQPSRIASTSGRTFAHGTAARSRRQDAANERGSRLAPPTSAPSMCGCATNAPMLSASRCRRRAMRARSRPRPRRGSRPSRRWRFRRVAAAGADRPDRLVGDDAARDVVGATPSNAARVCATT
jgi:hypothetical protein